MVAGGGEVAAQFHAHAYAMLTLAQMGATGSTNGLAALSVLFSDDDDMGRLPALEAIGWHPDEVKCDGL